MLCLRHNQNKAKKLDLRTKNFKVNIVGEQIEQIWANKKIKELDILFSNNLE